MGRYEGKCIVEWLPDGRRMALCAPFAFIDNQDEHWPVPADARIDGASIPQVLWTITGSPYTGKYRDASVIHDYYCSTRTRTSDATHAMFYEAMRVSGVSETRAKIMYAAVRYGGPRWSDMDVYNANLASGGRWAGTGGFGGYADGGAGHGMHYGGHGFGTAATMAGDYEGGMGMPQPMGESSDPARAWAPAAVSVQKFSELASAIESGLVQLDTIGNLDAAPGNATDLPDGVFRFDAQPEM